jgi:hypothetical protein
MKKDLTIKEVASLGGKARWKNINQKKRKEIMSLLKRKDK